MLPSSRHLPRVTGWAVAGLVAGTVAADWLVARIVIPFGPGPDPVLAVALALMACGLRGPAGWVAFVGGALADLPGGVLLGLGGVTRQVACLVAERTWLWLQDDSYPSLVLVAFGAALAEGLLAQVGGWIFGVPWGSTSARAVLCLQGALLTTALFALVYPPAAWLAWLRTAGRAGLSRS